VGTLTVDAPILQLFATPTVNKDPTQEIPPHWVEQLRAMHGDDWRTVVRNCDRWVQSPEFQHFAALGDAVRGITAPTFIIRGDIEEAAHPLEQAVALHELIPNSWLWIAPHSRSLLTRDNPTDSVRIFRDFLLETSGPPAAGGAARPEHLALLGQVDLFAGLRPGALARLAALANVVALRAGDLVFRQGDPADALYVVAGGSFGVWVAAEAGQEPLRVRSLGPGACFGEMGLMTNQPRSATVRCERDGELLRISGAHFRALLQRDAAVALAAAIGLSRYVQAHDRGLQATGHRESPAGRRRRLSDALARIEGALTGDQS
jgi:CRP-like cAMP-binding protein